MNRTRADRADRRPAEPYQRPATRYVAAFIGLTNRLARRIQWRRGRGLRPARAAARRLPPRRFRGRARAPGEPDALALAGSMICIVGERARVEVIHFWLLGAWIRVITSGEYQR